MRVIVSPEHLKQIEGHGESTYPNEGAGFMLGLLADDRIEINEILPLENQREDEAQHNRYELSPVDFLRAEKEADRLGLSLVGVFHSHPDHPAIPSEFDRDHAWPHFSYLISSIQGGKAKVTRAWRLREDRSMFDEDEIQTIKEED